MSLASFERTLRNLSKAYAFYWDCCRHEDTALSECMKKIVFCCGWTNHLHWLIAPKRLKLEKWEWTHSKERYKGFPNLMDSNRSGLKIMIQRPLKLIKNGTFLVLKWWFSFAYSSLVVNARTRPDTRPSVTCGWAGAVMPKNRRKSYFLWKRDGPTDQRTDGPMDQWTNRPMDGHTLLCVYIFRQLINWQIHAHTSREKKQKQKNKKNKQQQKIDCVGS